MEGRAAQRPLNHLFRPPFLTQHLMHFVPVLLFFCSHICLTHWTPERNIDVAAFALLVVKLLSPQVTANQGDVWPACGNSASSEHLHFYLRAVLVLQSSGFQSARYYKELLVRSYWLFLELTIYMGSLAPDVWPNWQNGKLTVAFLYLWSFSASHKTAS